MSNLSVQDVFESLEEAVSSEDLCKEITALWLLNSKKQSIVSLPFQIDQIQVAPGKGEILWANVETVMWSSLGLQLRFRCL